MPFASKIHIKTDNQYANQTIEFESLSSLGAVINDDNLIIDGNVSIDEIDLNDYVVTSISKQEWSFSDNKKYYDQYFSRKFEKSEPYQVTLKVWSQKFTLEDGRVFYFVHSSSKTIDVQSRFYLFLINHYSSWESIRSKEYDDYMKAAGRFFDRMHSAVSDIFTLIDIDNIDPKMFEYVANNFGHSDKYVSKVGYDITENDFDNYDILYKIQNNIATEKEISCFRKFLKLSSEIFKGKGTNDSLKKFLSFFSIDAKVIELWQETWDTYDIKEENFVGNFEEGELKLKVNDLRTVGVNNDTLHLVKNNGNIIIDNYFKVQKIEYPADVFTQAPIIGKSSDKLAYETLKFIKEVNYDNNRYNLDGTKYFDVVNTWMTPLETTNLKKSLYGEDQIIVNLDITDKQENRIIYDDYIENEIVSTVNTVNGTCINISSTNEIIVKNVMMYMIQDLRHDSGIELVNIDENFDLNSYVTDWTTVLSVNTTAYALSSTSLSAYNYLEGYYWKNFIELSDEYLEEGERISVQFNIANDKKLDNVVSTIDQNITNSDISLKFKINEILEKNKILSYVEPTNEIFITFRGVRNNNDTYAHIAEYYRFGINFSNSTFSLSKISSNQDNEKIIQKLKLNNDISIYDGYIDQLDPSSMYELKVSIIDNYVYAYIRRLEKETYNIKINSSVCSSYLGDSDESTWTLLLDGFNLNVNESMVKSEDIDGNELVSIEYVPITVGGNIGFGVTHGSISVYNFKVCILDEDETLHSTLSKEINLKSRYQEWLRNNNKYFNSYKDQPYRYDITIKEDINVAENINVSSINTNNIDYMYVNNVVLRDESFTRFTVSLKKEWLKENFVDEDGNLNKDKLFKSIVVPIGDVRDDFTTEYVWVDKDIYRDYNGDISGNIGLFTHNPTQILGKYNLKSHDELSSLSRDITSSNIIYDLKINDKLATYIKSEKHFNYNGLYEEVCPLSTYFTDVNGVKILNSSEQFENKLFNPILQKNKLGQKVIGVFFRHCNDIKEIISRHKTDTYTQVECFGSFTIHVPDISIEYAPDKSKIKDSVLFDGMKQYDIFVPLGILDPDIKNYSLSKQFLKMKEDYFVQMNGFYIKVSSENTTYNVNDGIIKIIKPNPYESAYERLYCNYFVCAEVDLCASIYNNASIDLNATDEYIHFFIDQHSRKLLNTVPTSADFEWWIPNNIWRRRDFNIETIVASDDLATNLNYDGNVNDCSSNFSKIFYGNKIGGFNLNSFGVCEEVIPPRKSLQLRLTDGNVSLNKVYYAKIKIKYNYLGTDANGIDLLSDVEKKNINIGTGKKNKKELKLSPFAKCVTVYMPISFSDNQNILSYGNFIRGSKGNSDSPAITYVPIFLMNEIMNTLEEKDKNLLLNMINSENWNLTEWNDYFANNIVFEEILEEVDSSNYKLNNKYGLTDTIIPNGSYINIAYNTSDYSCNVIENNRYFISTNNTQFFDVPPFILNEIEWYNRIQQSTLNNYILPVNSYTINNNSIVFNDSIPYNINGSDLYAAIKYTNIENNQNIVQYKQDFIINNEITFNIYESNEDGKFKVIERKPSLNSLIYSKSVYDVVLKEGKYCLQSSNETNLVDKNKVGTTVKNGVIKFNNSSQPLINKLYVVDKVASIFEFETSVLFDKEIDNIKNYKGKKFEYVIKATSNFNNDENSNILNSYYFLGIGTYGYDVALGIAVYDDESKKMKKSILASYGNYNKSTIKTNTWYKLKVKVTNNNILIYFGEDNQNNLLVINYNIDPSLMTDKNRYFLGNYEQEQYIASELNKLSINYPKQIAESISSTVFNEIYDENVILKEIPNGVLTGFIVYDQYTYVSDIMFTSTITNTDKFSGIYEIDDKTEILEEYVKLYGSYNTITYFSKLNNGNYIFVVDGNLYGKKINSDISLLTQNVNKVISKRNSIIVDVKYELISISEDFNTMKTIRIKDDYFNTDSMYRYLQYTNKNIHDIYIENNKVIIILKDI